MRLSPGTALLELKSPLYAGMGIVLACHINVEGMVRVLSEGEFLTL